MVWTGWEQTKPQHRDLKFDAKRMFSRVLMKKGRLDIMPNNHGRGGTAFKHFPCIRLLKWHSFAGCWHMSWGILQTHGITSYVHPWFKHERYSFDQGKTDTSGSCRPCGKRREKKQAIWQSRVCHAELTSLLSNVNWQVRALLSEDTTLQHCKKASPCKTVAVTMVCSRT